jgi:hypothetical protein
MGLQPLFNIQIRQKEKPKIMQLSSWMITSNKSRCWDFFATTLLNSISALALQK